MDWNWFLHDPVQWMVLLLPITPLLIFMIYVIATSDKRKEKKYKKKLMKDDKKKMEQHIPVHLKEYYDALEDKDVERMREALEKNAASCPSRNSYCLTEVFCPDCPLANGGLAVQSYRKDW